MSSERSAQRFSIYVRQKMSALTNYTEQIRRHYPDLAVRTATLNPDGQYNDVLVVNDAYIFRFAKVRPAINSTSQSIAHTTEV